MVRKVKNILYFEIEGEERAFDLNAFQFIGKSGQLVKTPPQGYRESARVIKNFYDDKKETYPLFYKLFACLYSSGYSACYENKYMFEFYEKLQALNIGKFCAARSTDNAKFALVHFKVFVKWLQTEDLEDYDLYKFREWYEHQQLKPHLSFMTKAQQEIYCQFFNRLEWLPYARIIHWYMLKNRVYDLYDMISKYSISDRDIYRNSICQIRDLVTYAKFGNIQIPKCDLGTALLQVIETYYINKSIIDIQKLQENQLNKGLEFEYGDYIVVVPTTPDQFKDEAEQQGNCVYRIYMDKVVQGHTNVVFIRRKDDIDKSVVTCEVYNNAIDQYLLKNNARVYDDSQGLLTFAKKYQEHLNNNK